ncbi:MAG: DNA repair protein RecN [Bacteroidetes bacterium]|nr:DNA repair protein RecN [Bacteroidota bacterium]
MLLQLRVRNFALIRSLTFSPQTGMNVITGETGAGKSILLGALGLVTGNRAELSALLNQNEKCIVEAEFDIQSLNLQELFEELDLDYEPICILRREISAQGKSRAFVNDTPVQLSTLKQLSGHLVQVHTQNTGTFISDPLEQLHVVDDFAGNSSINNEYRAAFREWKNAIKNRETLLEKKVTFEREQDFLRFQHEELSAFLPVVNEEAELNLQIQTLANADEISKVCRQAVDELTENELSITDRINSVKQLFRQAERFLDIAENYKNRIQGIAEELKELSREIDNTGQLAEHNPDLLETLQQRQARMQLLFRKHAVDSSAALLGILKNLEEKMQEAHHLDEEIENTATQIAECEKKVLMIGKTMQDSRQNAGNLLMIAVGEQLQKLGMPHAMLTCEWIQHEDKPDINGLSSLRMTFRANAGSPLLPLEKVASGGELSRVNFCLKSLTAMKKTLPTLIYDEADTGISGEIALQMARMMRNMAMAHQLICITHLPQVAAAGNCHFRIFKEESEAFTESKITLLNSDERILHLAYMLSGSTAGSAAVGNAHELLKMFAD